MDSETQELVDALQGFRKSVQQFQSAVTQLDNGLAAFMQTTENHVARMENICQTYLNNLPR